MYKRVEAKTTLVTYFSNCYHFAGIQWTNDNTVEVEGIIDAIFEGIIEKLAPKPDSPKAIWAWDGKGGAYVEQAHWSEADVDRFIEEHEAD